MYLKVRPATKQTLTGCINNVSWLYTKLAKINSKNSFRTKL